MTLDEARTWFGSTAGLRLIGDIDGDCDAALDAAGRLIGRLGAYPPSVTADLRRAVTEVERAQDAFNVAVNLLVQGRARDARQVTAAYRGFVTALLRLQSLTARHGAYVEAQVAEVLARLCEAGREAFNATIRRETRAMLRDLERVSDLLARARRREMTAQAQRIVNAAFTTVGGVLGLIGRFERAALALDLTARAVTAALSAAMGPSDPGPVDFSMFGIGAVIDHSEGLSPGVGALNSAAGLLTGLLADGSAVAEAQDEVRRAEAELERLQRLFQRYVRRVTASTSQMRIVQRLAEGAARDAWARARAFRASDAAYRELTRTLESIE